MNNFSTQIKTAKTDEWYTQEKDVAKIVPYLHGGITRYFARSTQKKVILLKC